MRVVLRLSGYGDEFQSRIFGLVRADVTPTPFPVIHLNP